MFDLGLLSLPVVITTVLAGAFIFLLHRYSIRNFNYWKERGIPSANTVPLLGSMHEIYTLGFHDLEDTRYKKLGRLYGHFEGSSPAISVGDPRLISDILSKDFSSFINRRPIITGNEYFDKMVANAQGEDWRRIRSIVSPTFTTGKIKRMLNIFKECSEILCDNFRSAMKANNYVETRSLYGTFSMDVIASSAFSTKIDSHNDPNNKFVKMAKKTFTTSFTIRILLYQMIPRVMKFFGVYSFEKEPTDFFVNVTHQIVEERRKSGKSRNDFLQLLIDTAKEVTEEEEEADEKGDIAANYNQDIEKQILKVVTSKQLTMNELVAQCVIFFLAGYHTTAVTLGFVTHSLAVNPDVQDRLRKEVDEALKKNNGELTYEAIQGMKYLDNVISETMRLYPPAVRLERSANEDYKLGDTGITIPKGMVITVPVFAIHRDPEFYPDPEKFDPDRFSPEERSMRDPYAYIPFGAGPRNCVGMRFALMEIKTCLAYVIAKFIIKKCPKTKEPLDFIFGQGILQAKEINVALEERKNVTLVSK